MARILQVLVLLLLALVVRCVEIDTAGFGAEDKMGDGSMEDEEEAPSGSR